MLQLLPKKWLWIWYCKSTDIATCDVYQKFPSNIRRDFFASHQSAIYFTSYLIFYPERNIWEILISAKSQ